VVSLIQSLLVLADQGQQADLEAPVQTEQILFLAPSPQMVVAAAVELDLGKLEVLEVVVGALTTTMKNQVAQGILQLQLPSKEIMVD
jgi:hypothetical protein